MEFTLSKKLQSLPPYLFVEIDRAKRAARQQGRDIIDFGIGDPDTPTPAFIIEALGRAAADPANHRYALDAGMPALRQAIAAWYTRRFSVGLDPDREILPLIGSKEGIAHFPLAFLNDGDYSLIPDPCYPPYKGGTIFAGGAIHLMPLLEKNAFLPDLSAIPSAVLKKAKIIYVNYPNNPTSATCGKGFYKDLVSFAVKHNLIVVSDLAYSELYYDGKKPPSFFEVEGSREVGIEFHSLSKTFNMTGWRAGWACGNEKLVQGLAKVKSNIDSGIFSAIQVTATAALAGSDSVVEGLRSMYQERRDMLSAGLKKLGFSLTKPEATFYLWARNPGGRSSMEAAAYLLEKADIVVTPGTGFGENGEGYIRFALTVPKDRIRQALDRLAKTV